MEGCWGREERGPHRSGKKGGETAAAAEAARENEVDAKGPSAASSATQVELQKEEAGRGRGGSHSDESDLGGHFRWSEASALEDDDVKERCLHFSRKLCSRVREEWGKSYINGGIIIISTKGVNRVQRSVL